MLTHATNWSRIWYQHEGIKILLQWLSELQGVTAILHVINTWWDFLFQKPRFTLWTETKLEQARVPVNTDSESQFTLTFFAGFPRNWFKERNLKDLKRLSIFVEVISVTSFYFKRLSSQKPTDVLERFKKKVCEKIAKIFWKCVNKRVLMEFTYGLSYGGCQSH